MTRPRLLDLFCCEGGAGYGYGLAGFDVTGVDNQPQPRYPFEFIEADALEVLADRKLLSGFDAIHASPPCQAYSATRAIWNNPGGHPELVEPVRGLLRASGLPWVMENVAGAPVAAHVVLCGTMFGLGTGVYELRRHRLFETSGFFCLTPPCQHRRPVIGVYGGHARDRRRRDGVALGIEEGFKALGVDWMTADGASEAVPPAYTEFLGAALHEHLAAERAA